MKLVFNKVKMSANMTCCIVDNLAGTYLPIAHRMSDFFSKVYYHSVNQNPFPKASMDSIGRGYDNIHRVDEFWGKLDDFDIIIFPDIYFNDWGSHLTISELDTSINYRMELQEKLQQCQPI